MSRTAARSLANLRQLAGKSIVDLQALANRISARKTATFPGAKVKASLIRVVDLAGVSHEFDELNAWPNGLIWAKRGETVVVFQNVRAIELPEAVMWESTR